MDIPKVTDKIDINFQVVETHDLKTFVVIDTSSWGAIAYKPSIIEITLPGESKKVVRWFSKGQINTFHSNALGLSCNVKCEGEMLVLPDGIYTVTVKGSPDKFRLTRHYLRTYKTQLELDKFYLKVVTKCGFESNCKLESVRNIQLLLDGASSATRLGDIVKAGELFHKAQSLLSKLDCGDCCK